MIRTFNSSLPVSEQKVDNKVLKFACCYGDGIGPEIMKAVISIISSAGIKPEPIEVEMGEKVYRKGVNSGITDETLEQLSECGMLLKAPITTPRGQGYKSLNVTLRKTFGLYANIRPVRSYPQVLPALPMDLIVVRENEEDTYAGIEHRQTEEVSQCLKLISRPACDRINNYAFKLAELSGRSKVTLMVKDNIMKITDGFFSDSFQRISEKYLSIESESSIIDIGSARLAVKPSDFEVIVTPNLYGDIISDIAAEVSGSVGLCGSANIGAGFAMFEAVHGSAPDIAGRNIANPSGLLKAACMMLTYAGYENAALNIENAWLRTLEDGVYTADIAAKTGEEPVSTAEFAEAVIERTGKKPQVIPVAQPVKLAPAELLIAYSRKKEEKTLKGVDIFIDWDADNRNPDILAAELTAAAEDFWHLDMITNRGVKVYPRGNPFTEKTDHWRCRFTTAGSATNRAIIGLLSEIESRGLECVKTENLYDFNGSPGYSAGQGQ